MNANYQPRKIRLNYLPEHFDHKRNRLIIEIRMLGRETDRKRACVSRNNDRSKRNNT